MANRLKEREEKANELSASEGEGEWLDVAEMRFNSLMEGHDKGIAEADFFKRFGIR